MRASLVVEAMVSQEMLQSLLSEDFSQGLRYDEQVQVSSQGDHDVLPVEDEPEEESRMQPEEASSMRGEYAAPHEEEAETANRERMDTMDTNEDWKHTALECIGLRAMNGEVSMNEVCRHIKRALLEVIEEEPRFDMSWLLRSVRDVCTLAVRGLARNYAPKNLEDFTRVAWVGMRFLCEEAVRRVMSVMRREKRMAYANFIRCVRNWEVSLMPNEVNTYGLFFTFNEDHLRQLHVDFYEGISDIKRNPSFEAICKLPCISYEFLGLRIPAQRHYAAMLSKHDVEMIIEH